MAATPRSQHWPDDDWGSNPGDFLTPEQRLQAIAAILATIALRTLKQCDENKNI